MQIKRKLLLAGGGHTHALLLHQLRTDKRLFEYYDIELISEFPETYYSAMISGYLHGKYSISDLAIPIEKMCRDVGVKFTLGKFESQEHDVLSINTGGDYKENSLKPFQVFLKRLENITLVDSILLTGGGVAAVEVALGLRSRFNNRIAIFEKNNKLAGNLPASTSKKLEELCNRNKVEIYFRNPPNEKFSFEVNATGSTATVEVNPTLQSKENSNVFAVGDAADGGWPRSGVYAVKQAPVLYENLVRIVEGGKLIAFKPQKNALVLITTSKSEALGAYGEFSLPESKIFLKLKNSIDLKFIRKFQ